MMRTMMLLGWLSLAGAWGGCKAIEPRGGWTADRPPMPYPPSLTNATEILP